jgi:hypothetical protein
MPSAMAPAACGPSCRPKATRWGTTRCEAGCGPADNMRPAPAYHAGRPGRRRGREPAAGPAHAHEAQPGLGGRHHLPAPPGRRVALPGCVAGPLLTQNRGLGRA